MTRRLLLFKYYQKTESLYETKIRIIFKYVENENSFFFLQNGNRIDQTVHFYPDHAQRDVGPYNGISI